jgi:hypothetical protein
MVQRFWRHNWHYVVILATLLVIDMALWINNNH